MKRKIVYIISTVLLTIGFAGCSDNDESFDNKIYINSKAKTANILLQGNDVDEAKFQVAMPHPENRDIKFTVSANPSLVSAYNEAYYDKASILPEKYYKISDSEVTINAGNLNSKDITVSFNNLTELDRLEKFVLPVSISSSYTGVLQSARTMYYVVKGAALINVVAEMAENNVYIDWVKPDDFTAMRQFTAEALIRPRSFDKMLSTIMGIEGKFLIRVGDASIPYNQLQVATSSGNYTSSDLAISTNVWTHVAVTYDADAREINVFLNGKNMYRTATEDIGTVNWGVPHSDEADGKPRCFWFGYSYNNDRYLDGEMSECRVWNKVLTAEDINQTNWFYYVDPESEGLIGYWKFNDGGGSTVKDYSVNGNDGTASNPLKWTEVELPVEE